MVNPRRSAGSHHKASHEACRELLNRLGVPLGTVTVARRPTREGETLVVRMTAPGVLLVGRQITRFHGFPVTYEIVPPLKIGKP